MTDKQGKVGDVCGWLDVPDRGLARTKDGSVAYRNRGRGVFVAQPGEPWLGAKPWADEGKWRWGNMSLEETVTIIALDVPADATAEHLRELAEVFEVREAWERLMLSLSAKETEGNDAVTAWFADNTRNARVFIASLHRADWRPGMTAEDAARLLAEAG